MNLPGSFLETSDQVHEGSGKDPEVSWKVQEVSRNLPGRFRKVQEVS
jgi:hypothetical protein